MTNDKSLKERLFHAASFELLALAICAPVFSWLLGVSLGHMGALTVMISLIAMLWNMLFNTLFDRLQRHLGFERSLPVRIGHAALFELGLICAVVPLAAWWLGVSLFEALLLDLGILLFFMPYTVAFNWVYDMLRDRWLTRRELTVST
ncbi:multidrug/biocide efflux PACE transporter [Crenobacter sp. SG2303]|uniref:Multidrug/biocide efflux PACE transporter n=1 Tax=Crenobacter oryzisoli TaxID=3056844 RepID=A0ABT7XIT4_9NEIS|nr:multidrug/biocide efflux PACE transporter [Crenobacter sp. SG2303]MDN0073698.1 multidrug/biocide efflux PACE transporter [Crenobacter sp. SG2303]